MSSINLKTKATNKSLRVLMITGVYPTDELPYAGTFIKSQIDSLIEAGLEVEIIHPKPGPVIFRYTSATIQNFLKTLTGRFDIVHGHYGLWCLVARLQWTTPVVASFLGDDLLGTVNADGSYNKKSALVVRISSWLCQRVDAVIVKSEGMKKVAPAREGHIFIIPNGVDFELFRPISRSEARVTLGWDRDRYYVLFGNNPHIPVKNFPLAQAAIERLQTRGLSVELVVASSLPQNRVVQYINASNVLILPSIAEGSPNIVKETMACNVPVVATNVGDVLQVIGNTKGCKVCTSDPDALAAALEEALLHSQPTTGRDDISHLNRSEVAQQVIATYESVVNNKVRGQESLLIVEGNTIHGKSQ